VRPARPPLAEYTWDDFIALDEDDPRELVCGDLVEIEVPGLRHEHAVGVIGFELCRWCLAHKAGRVLLSGYKIRIDDHHGVMPDAQVYRRGNPARLEEAGLTEGRPDLAVEVVSPSSGRYDRVRKLQWYAGLGVPEYWVVDPNERSLWRLVLQGDHYVVAQVHEEAETFRPESFPGLEIPLATLWDSPEEPPAP